MGANPGHSPSPSFESDYFATPLAVGHRTHQSPGQPFSRAIGSVSDSPEVQRAMLGPEDGDVIHGLTAYPTVAQGDSVLWSRWDSLSQLGSKPR